MDWNTVHTNARPDTRKPRLELLERCWRMRTVATGRELVCGIYQTDAGLEVRAGYRTDLLHSQRARTIEQAREIATAFKHALIGEYGVAEELTFG